MTTFRELVHEKHVDLGIRSGNCDFCWVPEKIDKRPMWVQRMRANARVFQPATGAHR